jgi:hypothetical protein
LGAGRVKPAATIGAVSGYGGVEQGRTGVGNRAYPTSVNKRLITGYGGVANRQLILIFNPAANVCG